jgi:hypothetical protein
MPRSVLETGTVSHHMRWQNFRPTTWIFELGL